MVFFPSVFCSLVFFCVQFNPVHPLQIPGITFLRRSSVQFKQLPGINFLKRSTVQKRKNSRSDKNDHIDRELLSISFFSFLHQAAMPFAELIDSAYLSTQNYLELGAMGVAKSSQNSFSKLCNSPLSKTTISLVASSVSEDETSQRDEVLSSAVSAALAFASLIGICQLLVFTCGANAMLNVAGLSPSNSMHMSALMYTRARALGAPYYTIWLVAQNIFRGLGDARSPLIGALIFNLLNVLTDYFFLQKLGLGIVGSAFASAIAQATALVPLLWILNKRVPINFRLPFSTYAQYLSSYGEAAVYLLGRSVARTAAYSYSSRRAALLGPVVASSYSIMYQIGLWTTMVCEAIAIANHALLSRVFSDSTENTTPTVNHLVKRSCQAGIFIASIMSLIVYLCWDQIISVFTTSTEIQSAAASSLPYFLFAQILKGFALPMNGVLFGFMDWQATMWSMCASNVACFLTLRLCHEQSAKVLWVAWAASYTAQGLVLFIRYCSRIRKQSRLSQSRDI